jgi:putative hydrolase of the HAD superfamily
VSLSIPDRVVVFDYGEVISMSQSELDRQSLLDIASATAEEFWPVYWRHRDELDHGTLPITDYWRRVERDLGREWSMARIQLLWAADFRSWISVEPQTIDLLGELHDGGTRLALLSNAGFDFGDPFRRAPFGAYFERVFVSAELGLLKPDPAVYRKVADELGITTEQLIFVDNKAVNVEGAVSVGAVGHTFTDVSSLRDFLTSLAITA